MGHDFVPNRSRPIARAAEVWIVEPCARPRPLAGGRSTNVPPTTWSPSTSSTHALATGDVERPVEVTPRAVTASGRCRRARRRACRQRPTRLRLSDRGDPARVPPPAPSARRSVVSIATSTACASGSNVCTHRTNGLDTSRPGRLGSSRSASAIASRRPRFVSGRSSSGSAHSCPVLRLRVADQMDARRHVDVEQVEELCDRAGRSGDPAPRRPGGTRRRRPRSPLRGLLRPAS